MEKIKIAEFKSLLAEKKVELYREMPWRDDTSLYSIVVSEIMLQQTQVSRVMKKYPEFLSRFPSFERLAQASWAEVLTHWQGLGYQRRAKWLHGIAQHISQHGEPERTQQAWDDLPGIGSNTAGSILAYAYNLPTVFIETNIRRVFIYHLFPNRDQVDDKEIMPIIEKTLDRENPREWYWGLMDYGSTIPKSVANPNRKSKHYAKQSTFKGSKRELRAQVLRYCLEDSRSPLDLKTKFKDQRLDSVLADLQKESMLANDEGGEYRVG